MSAPVALNTTKRKFHKLLDNLTASRSHASLASTLQDEQNESTTSLTSSRTEPPSKRSRLSGSSMEGVTTPPGNRPRLVTRESILARKSFERPNSVRAVGSGLTTKASPKSSTPRKAPNYVPYNHEAFLARLKTFADVRLWSLKPDKIGEVEWAKRGWVCEAWNTVACKGGCEQRVMVILRPKRKDEKGEEIEGSEDVSLEVEEGLVERYEEKIVDGHEEGCLWRKAGCKNDIYHIPIARRDHCEAELLRRYRSFKPIEPHLPPAESITYPEPPASDLITLLPANFFNQTLYARPTASTAAKSTIPPKATTTTATSPEPPNITAFAFALFGWSGVKQEGLNLAICNHCFQRIGLWIYTSERLHTMAEKLEVEFSQLRLSLLETHREHCPWKNGASQANSQDGQLAGEPGWRTLQFMIGAFRKGRGGGVGDGEVEGRVGEGDRTEGIAEKWKKLKSKLKRSTSRKSLKSAGGDSK